MSEESTEPVKQSVSGVLGTFWCLDALVTDRCAKNLTLSYVQLGHGNHDPDPA